MVKTALNDIYIEVTTPTAMQNEVSTCHKIHYDKEAWVVVIQSVTEFYTGFLFKIYSLPQYVVLPLDIFATFFNNLIPDVRELFISEGFKVPPSPPTETNLQGNQILFLVKNAALEAETKRTIKLAVQPARGGHHPSIFVRILGLNPSIQMMELVIRLQAEFKKSIIE